MPGAPNPHHHVAAIEGAGLTGLVAVRTDVVDGYPDRLGRRGGPSCGRGGVRRWTDGPTCARRVLAAPA